MSVPFEHPFGRENEVSVRKLFQSFCNHLSIGQWECARACIRELVEQNELTTVKINDVLKDVARNPYSRRFGSARDGASNPHLLSWLCAEEIDQCVGNKEGLRQDAEFLRHNAEFLRQDAEFLRQDAEFRLLLVECCDVSGIDSSEIEGFYCLYRALQKNEGGTLDIDACSPALEKILLQNPTLGRSVILKLQEASSGSKLSELEVQLKDVYLVCFEKLVAELRTAPSCDRNGTEGIKLRLLDLFSSHDGGVRDEERSRYVSVCEELVDHVATSRSRDGSVCVSLAELYSCLVGQRCDDLLRIFSEAEATHKRKAYRCQASVDGSSYMSEKDWFCLSVLKDSDRQAAWKELFNLTQEQQRHFLDLVIEVGVKLIKDGEFEHLSELWNVEEFEPLKPLLFIIGWDQCSDLDSALRLVASHKQSRVQSDLKDACERLKVKARLLDTCCDVARRTLPAESEAFQYAVHSKLYTGVQLYSALQALHRCSTLGDLDPSQVLQFLQQLERECAAHGLCLPEENSAELFKAFSAVRCFTEALTASMEMLSWSPLTSLSLQSGSYSAGDSASLTTLRAESVEDGSGSKPRQVSRTSHSRQPPESTRMSRSVSVATSTASAAEMEELQTRYNEHVIKLLEQVKASVMALESFPFRIEMLENLFSLLFLRGEDIANTHAQSDSGEDGADFSLTLYGESCLGVETPVCRTPVSPITPPLFETPAFGTDANGTELRRTEKKVNHDLFGATMYDEKSSGKTNNVNKDAEPENEPKEQRLSEKEARESRSGHFSGSSVASNLAGVRERGGFLCNEYFMRDALILLKQCLDATDVTTLSSSNAKGHNVKIAVPDGAVSRKTPPPMQCSIPEKEAKMRAVTLTQHISEALWCFQLVSHDFVPFQFSKILSSARLTEEASSDDDAIDWSSSDESDIPQTCEKRKKRQPMADSLSGHTSDSQAATTDDSKGSLSRRRKRRLKRRGKRAYVRGVLTRNDDIVSRMLADKETLLAMCLRRGRIAQATQVVKLFSLEDSQQEAEVLFAEHFRSAISKIQSHDASSVTKPLTKAKKEQKRGGLAAFGKTALANVANTAARGLASVSVTSAVDQLLGLSLQPALSVSPHSACSSIVESINARLVPAMVVLDLACSSSNTIDSSNSLIDQALKLVPLEMRKTAGSATGKGLVADERVESKSAGNSQPLPVSGIVGFLHGMAAVMGQLSLCRNRRQSGESIDGGFERGKGGLATLVSGANSLLTHGVLSLRADIFRMETAFDEELQDLLSKARAELLDLTEKQEARTSRRRLTTDGNPPARAGVRQALKQLVLFLARDGNKRGLAQYIARNLNETNEDSVNYTKVLYEYMKTLSCLSAEIAGQSKEWMSQMEYFEQMSVSATSTIGKMVFEHETEPTKIEKVVSELGIELTDVLLHNCCPKLPFQSTPDTPPLSDNQGLVVLNEKRPRSVISGFTSIHGILLLWLHELRECSSKRHAHPWKITRDDVQCFVSGPRYAHVTRLTTRLRDADLSILTTGIDKLCFHGNLLQLLLLHTVCFIVKNCPHELRRFMRGVSDERFSFLLQKYCYRVGQLGLVSLGDLRRMVLSENSRTSQRAGGKDPWSLYCPLVSSEDARYFAQSIGTDVDTHPPFFKVQVFYPELLAHHRKRQSCALEIKGMESGYGDYEEGHLAVCVRLSEVDSVHSASSGGSVHSASSGDSVHSAPYGDGMTRRRASFSGMLRFDASVLKCSRRTELRKPAYSLTPAVESYLHSQSHVLANLAILFNSSIPSSASDLAKVRSVTESTCPALWTHVTSHVLPLCSTISSSNQCDTQFLEDIWDKHSIPNSTVLCLASPNSALFRDVICDVLRSLIGGKQWRVLSDLLLGCPALINCTHPEVVFLKDRAAEGVILDHVRQSKGSETELHEGAEESSQAPEGGALVWKLLMGMCEGNARSRLLIGCLELWDALTCVRHLQEYLHAIGENDVMRAAILEELDVMQVYMQICQCVDTQLNTGPTIELHYESNSNQFFIEETSQDDAGMEGISDCIRQHTVSVLMQLKMWQKVAELSRSSPDVILEFLLKVSAHDLTRKWIEIHGHHEFSQLVDEAHIKFLLEKSSPKEITEAMKILEKVYAKSSAECKTLCYSLIDQFANKQNTSILTEFMMRKLSGVLADGEMKRLMLLDIGCKALGCLPQNMQADYDHVIAEPVLLLEQLIMNMKVDLSRKVLRCITDEMAKYQSSEPNTPTNYEPNKEHHTSADDCGNEPDTPTNSGPISAPFPVTRLHSRDSSGNEPNTPTNSGPISAPFPVARLQSRDSSGGRVALDLDLADCNQLLVTYARKALEFPVVQPEVAGGGRLSILTSRSLGSMSSLQTRRAGAVTVATKTTPSPSRIPKVSSFGQLSNQGVKASTPPQPYPSSVPARSSPRFTLGSPEAQVKDGLPTVFVMPAEAPDRSDWVPDQAASVCMCCNVERFSMFNRRHHCRRCGRVVCSECSTMTLSVRGSSVRACDDCYQQSYKPKPAVLTSKERVERMRQTLSGTRDSPESLGASRLGSSANLELTGQGTVHLSGTGVEYQYILSLDENLNDDTREEFYYDHAPSASLCLSILDLHSDARQCGDVLLQMCDQISTYLQPIAPGVKNPEVDYGLVISMMKNLLFNAKVKFDRIGDVTGISKCELYLDRVKIVDLLVASNVAYIPSIQQLTRMDVLRRLRDKLIESEHWELAKDVSTKCGIDAAGVWVAWGKALLCYGDLPAAREKFARCLKAPLDKNQPQSGSKVLTDILGILENSVVSVDMTAGLLTQLKSVKDLLAEPQVPGAHDDDALESTCMQECLYYLRTYGTYASLLNFYQRRGLYVKALGLVYSEKCSSDIFIENLVIPALHSGEIVKLQDAMVTLDSSLDRWSSHLTAVCRHFNKNKMIHSLHRTQLFMKDFIRAAMTCVTYFYQKDATSYSDLYDRLQHLSEARRHMESYLDGRLWVDDSASPKRPGTSQPERLSRLIMTPREIAKYIHTIELQVEVTKYLNHYSENLRTIQSLTGPASLSPQRERGADASPEGASPGKSRQVALPELPTLFGSTRMKADVTSLVLLCGNNVNDGFGLAFRIIQDFKLDSGSIYTRAGVTLARLHRYQYIHQLLACMKDSGLCTDHHFDDVIIPCVEIMAREDQMTKEVEEFIRLMRSDVNKINAYMQCNKLKSAYLIAVKTQRVDVVKAIAQKAELLGQSAVKHICDKWLRQKAEKNDTKG